MRYIYSLKAAALAFIFFSVLTFLPIIKVEARIDIMLTVSTFLFAILIGYYISRIGNRYDTIRQLVATEDANILAFYKTCTIFGPAFTARIVKQIDAYYIVAYDHSLSDYAYKQTAPAFLGMWDIVCTAKKKEPDSAYQMLITQLNEIEKVRNTSSAVSTEKVHFGDWVMLWGLAFIVFSCLFLLRDGSFLWDGLVVLFSTAIVLIIAIVRDLANLMIGGVSLLEESGQEVLELIGLPRYYNKYFIDRSISVVPVGTKEYRIGLHKPGSAKTNIKLIKT